MRGVGALLVALAVAWSCASGGGSEDDRSRTPHVVEGSAWERHAGLPTPRTEVAVAAVGTRVFVAGGFTQDGETSGAVETFDLAGTRWSGVAPLPEPVHHAAMVAWAGRLLVFGGYRADGSASSKVWFLDPTRDDAAWEPLPDMPTPRGAHAAVLADERVHVVGGVSRFGGRTELVAAHHVYDVRRRTWSTQPALPDPRDHLAAAVIGDELYVVGGRELSAARNTGRLDVFDVQAQTWSRAPDMPTPRGGIAASVADGRLYVFGGETLSSTFHETEVFDPDTLRWAGGPPMPSARHGLGAATMADGRIAVAAGGPEPGLSVSDVVEVLTTGPGG